AAPRGRAAPRRRHRRTPPGPGLAVPGTAALRLVRRARRWAGGAGVGGERRGPRAVPPRPGPAPGPHRRRAGPARPRHRPAHRGPRPRVHDRRGRRGELCRDRRPVRADLGCGARRRVPAAPRDHQPRRARPGAAVGRRAGQRRGDGDGGQDPGPGRGRRPRHGYGQRRGGGPLPARRHGAVRRSPLDVGRPPGPRRPRGGGSRRHPL
ncbi:MAG: Adenosylcobinamide amidohydrolase, partial [uncultured Pseudonocardia sp.]